jgi:hypothetical protein
MKRIDKMIGALAVGALLAGCGSSAQSSTIATAKGTPASYNAGQANPVATPPLPLSTLERGSAQHQITEAIVAFYRAAWEDDASGACDEFSPAGVAGFMHAAKLSFPDSINRYSTCEHAMEIYSAALGESISTAQDNDTSFDPSALGKVGVLEIKISGDTATALAPTNVLDVINPERIDLQRFGKRWLINASQSLNKSNLPEILAKAEADGKLKAKHR